MSVGVHGSPPHDSRLVRSLLFVVEWFTCIRQRRDEFHVEATSRVGWHSPQLACATPAWAHEPRVDVGVLLGWAFANGVDG